MKETIRKVKRKLSEREKITVNETTDKELIFKIHKQLMQFTTSKANKPIKNLGQRPKQTFLQRRHTDS